MDLSGKYYKAFTDRQAAIEKQYSAKQAEKHTIRLKNIQWVH